MEKLFGIILFMAKQQKIAVVILLFLALGTRFFFFNYPAEVVFDEVHFGNFVRAYFTHENYFDIHPPLGKLLIAGAAKIGGAQISSAGLGAIGQDYNPRDLFALRFLPALISVLFVILIYFFCLRFTDSNTTALMAGLMVLFDNALIVQSRFILIDIFLLFFGFLSLYLLLKSEDLKGKKKWILVISSGIALGAVYSIKWTGLSIVLMLGILGFYQLYKNKNFKEFALKVIIIGTMSVLVYILSFAIHFSLLTKPGPGDAFLSQNFQSKNFPAKFYELNQKMYSYNASITTEHPFQSKWHQWPFGQKQIFYWQKAPKEIWLAGNLVVWILGTISIILGVMLVLLKLIFRKPRDFSFFIPSFLIAGWLANFLPFSLVTRPLFLYTYFFALVFSILLFAYLFSYALNKLFVSQKKKTAVILLFSLSIILYFLTAANLTYGI